MVAPTPSIDASPIVEVERDPAFDDPCAFDKSAINARSYRELEAEFDRRYKESFRNANEWLGKKLGMTTPQVEAMIKAEGLVWHHESVNVMHLIRKIDHRTPHVGGQASFVRLLLRRGLVRVAGRVVDAEQYRSSPSAIDARRRTAVNRVVGATIIASVLLTDNPIQAASETLLDMATDPIPGKLVASIAFAASPTGLEADRLGWVRDGDTSVDPGRVPTCDEFRHVRVQHARYYHGQIKSLIREARTETPSSFVAALQGVNWDRVRTSPSVLESLGVPWTLGEVDDYSPETIEHFQFILALLHG